MQLMYWLINRMVISEIDIILTENLSNVNQVLLCLIFISYADDRRVLSRSIESVKLVSGALLSANLLIRSLSGSVLFLGYGILINVILTNELVPLYSKGHEMRTEK